ncbi:MAG: hypothetical protein OXN17_19985 [Candidatus Poribacteria bacterium]|nr:hypothetical protein [Candidatus Poribacteria bacterium]MDE0505531.1 hypothetical protein [Candidatus Poribacteria bacterium]
MHFQSVMTVLMVVIVMVSSHGCLGLQGFSAEQQWSSNFVLADGVRANDPAIIDGNVRTVGQSQYVESTGDMIMSFGSQSESIITLPEPKSIHRVIIHSSNLQAFDIWTTDSQGRWEKIKEVESNKKKIIDIRLNRTVFTSGIKIRIRRTSDDAGQRRKNVQNIRGWRTYSGKVNAPAKISEIELYGFVSKSDAVSAVPQASTSNKGEELDALDEFLK